MTKAVTEFKVGEQYTSYSEQLYECIHILPDGKVVMKWESPKGTWGVTTCNKSAYFVHVTKPLSCSAWVIVTKYDYIISFESEFEDFGSDEGPFFSSKEEAQEAWDRYCDFYGDHADLTLLDIIEIKWTNR